MDGLELLPLLQDYLPNMEVVQPPPSEIWCAYNSDGSAYCIFPTEVEALRHALAYTMSGIKKVTWGDLCEQVRT